MLGHGWLTESEFLSFIAVSESTPGPLAVNMATFIGASQAGLAGSFAATVGVVLPSFVIILLIAAALHSLMKYAGVNAFLAGVRPCVVAMILAFPRWGALPPFPAALPRMCVRWQCLPCWASCILPIKRKRRKRRPPSG